MKHLGQTQLEDRFSRKFAYLRISLTDVCNFSCSYCLPGGYSKFSQNCSSRSPLELHEIRNLVQAFAELGVWKIRLTGGEPTLRDDLLPIAQMISEIPGIKNLSLSTNGNKLKSLAPDFIKFGIKNLNISVDSLDPNRFAELCGVDRLNEILLGVDLALNLPFHAVKINAVLLKETFHQEFELFQHWVKTRKLTVRFIELMQTGKNSEFFSTQHISGDSLRELLISQGWKVRPRSDGDGPALEFENPIFSGKFGIIAPYSKDFCTTCNRLRITAQGELKLCLFGNENHSLRELLQSPDQKGTLQDKVLTLLQLKKTSHELQKGLYGNNQTFSAIGG